MLMLFLFYTQEHIYIIVHIQYSIIHILSISQLIIDSTSLLTSLEFETVLLLLVLYIGMQLLHGEKNTKKLVKQSTISFANPNFGTQKSKHFFFRISLQLMYTISSNINLLFLKCHS